MTDSRETTMNSVKVSHNIASMLDANPSYSIVQQKDKNDYLNSSRRRKFAIINSLVAVYNAIFLLDNHIFINTTPVYKNLTIEYLTNPHALVFFFIAFNVAVINAWWIKTIYKKSASYGKLSEKKKHKRIQLIFLIYSVLFAATL